MFCKKCGRQLDEGETLCPACGTLNSAETSANTTPTTIEYGAPAADETLKSRMAGSVLTWGILSLAFADTFFLSLLGFIFSFIAKQKADEYRHMFGDLTGRAKVGHILGRVGFGLGLGLTIIFALYVALIVLIVALGVSA